MNCSSLDLMFLLSYIRFIYIQNHIYIHTCTVCNTNVCILALFKVSLIYLFFTNIILFLLRFVALLSSRKSISLCSYFCLTELFIDFIIHINSTISIFIFLKNVAKFSIWIIINSDTNVGNIDIYTRKVVCLSTWNISLLIQIFVNILKMFFKF